ncbi:MAG: PorV/PorQ family protein [Gemmatimonadota bacterium]|nr:MAG: PorV/PorQ family protein [Gemmatimonadota bacterium]
MRSVFFVALVLTALAVTLISQPVLCSDIDSKAGTTGYGFLKIGAGARPVAMGGAFAGVRGDIHCSYWNPSGLAWIEAKQATATYRNYLLDIQSGFIGYTQPYKNMGVFGITVQYVNYGNIDQIDFNETTGQIEHGGSFGAHDIAIGLSYGRLVTDEISVGATLYPLIRESIDQYSATAVAFSFGFQYHLPVEAGLTVGAAFQNLGTTLNGFTDDHKDDLPANLKLGGGLRLAHLPILIALDINKSIDLARPVDLDEPNFKFNLGTEVTPNDLLHFRMGYRVNSSDLKVGSSKDTFVGFTGGFGLNLRSYTLDYALSSFGELGFVHRITVSALL